MANVFILNGHHPYSFSEGKLNASLVARMKVFFENRGDTVRVTETAKDYDIETEIGNHLWADIVIMQFPVNWMGVPWSFKKYQDLVWTAGIDGRLCEGDGRSAGAPKENYGAGGKLKGTKYMLSLTYNAPKEAFDDPKEFLFEGASVDDLMFPLHMNARFFAMEKLPTFAAYDVMKNADVESDFKRFDAHLNFVFGAKSSHAAA
ncbi:NAD(P)H-dependent oxidoreductase [Roseibium sp. RKSG952]|uniref:NAD(P)H-dependent oxidoreductase n=1 Tax=Roseibium sp. RKSG952 TaxID=2529384 RepID=UPI0012BC593B|nr:NAD(P)H-dependent oxidoreductase [Roseibium sp. RKSG952]MTH98811.1 flavodoxin family protein [Roseibium sp. RKSG952]